EFNNDFEAFKTNIILKANEILEKLGYQITFSLEHNLADFDDYNKDKMPLLSLKIIDYYGQEGSKIGKPQSFLNEAKWSAIGLSIRLAVLEQRLQNAPLKILALDDLMISLDMSNRDKVLSLIFSEYLSRYQVFILTHDRVFFELVRREIEYKSQSNDWIMYEMFVDDKSGIEQPFIRERKDLLVKARGYLAEKDYPACANTLRQVAEQELKRLVPVIARINKKGIAINEIGSIRNNTGILQKANLYFTNEGLTDFIPFLYGIDKYKDTIFNPQSHYNAYSQVYREELKASINLLTTLHEIKNDIILPVDSLIKINFQTQSGVTYSYTAKLKDDFKQYKYEHSNSIKIVWSKISFEVQGCHCSKCTIPPFSRKYPRKNIQDNYKDLATFTEDYHKNEAKIDQTDVIRDNLEVAFTDQHGNTLNSLKRY
ncbi:MAG: hypothetical protein JJT94_02120, partial [Bernardetiaceae bacterium]|nr:hypothetical protein [Bernardetiaceae bacterium]